MEPKWLDVMLYHRDETLIARNGEALLAAGYAQ
jgi:hypothetical protein